jgi:hypothetical protein
MGAVLDYRISETQVAQNNQLLEVINTLSIDIFIKEVLIEIFNSPVGMSRQHSYTS